MRLFLVEVIDLYKKILYNTYYNEIVIRFKEMGNTMSEFEERRKYTRYPVIEQLSVRFNNTFLKRTECTDLSMGGMCIVVEDKIDEIANYGIVFLVQKYGEEVIFFESKFIIMWDRRVSADRDDIRLGVKFFDVDDENLNSLSRIVSLKEEQIKQRHNK